MAKLTYFNLLGDGGSSSLGGFYTEGLMTLEGEPSTSETAIFFDAEQSTEIVFKGSGFSYDGGDIATGTVNKIRFLDSEGGKFAEVTNLKADAATLMDLFRGGTGLDGMLLALLDGDDVITGTGVFDILNFGTGKGSDNIVGGGGVDEIGGGVGKDILTGGGGNDFFVFFKGDGKDVITDFDAFGGEGNQDLILQTFDKKSDIDIIKSGDDTIIDFGGGSTLTLLDVDRKDVSMADFGNQ